MLNKKIVRKLKKLLNVKKLNKLVLNEVDWYDILNGYYENNDISLNKFNKIEYLINKL